MKQAILVFTAMLAVVTTAVVAEAHKTEVVVTVEKKTEVEDLTPAFKGNKPAVDVAILLDTSNSMDGLINQAKSQLWTIVQQFAKAKKNGKTPLLRVALFEYGNTRLPASEGYIRQVVALTDDLDQLSESLFALTTNGGDEYCGQVIDEAITRLDWTKEPGAYKAIFIAGNEPFTQGKVDFRKACSRAIQSGIIVNTIHCGGHQEGVNGHWQEGADLAEGEFFNIDQDRAVVHIKCPQDKIILELNAELNSTYLWYGAEEKRSFFSRNQAAQDANAESLNQSVAVGRVLAKSSPAYQNVARCMVDSFIEDESSLSKIKLEDLPEKLREMSPKERKAHVKKLAAQREEVKKKISKLAKERESFLVETRKSRAEEAGEATLGDAVVSTINKQLIKTGFDAAK